MFRVSKKCFITFVRSLNPCLVFSLKLDNGHKLLCPWIDNACNETLARFPPATPPVLVDNFRERCFALFAKLNASSIF